MENERTRSSTSTDLGFSQNDLKSFGFQDFQYEENHIWCEQCKRLKQELKKLQDDNALNYSTLKKKIISTDLLIKKYKAKCDEYDAQTKKHEDFFRKYEDLQRESETLNTQLGSTLQQLEPLRKAKAALESDNKQKQAELQSLKDKVEGCELTVRQYEENAKELSTYKDRYDMLKKENQRKVQNLETVIQKNESVISKLKDENKNLRTENSLHLKKQRKSEDKIKKVVERIDRYWILLRQNGLLPKGEKKIVTEKFLDVSGDFSVSQDEEEETAGEVNSVQPSVYDESSNESDKFPWIFSPLVQAVSPLPPSPMPCRTNKSLIGNAESDEENIDEMANLLQSELLKSSPVRQSPKSMSLLRKVQTRSPLIERKQIKPDSLSNDTKSSSMSAQIPNNSSMNDIESLSDSDSENIISKQNKINSAIENDKVERKIEKTTGDQNYNAKKNSQNSVQENIEISEIKGNSDNCDDERVKRSEHSAFEKIAPRGKSGCKKFNSHTEIALSSCNEPKNKHFNSTDLNSDLSVVNSLFLNKKSNATFGIKIEFTDKTMNSSNELERVDNSEINDRDTCGKTDYENEEKMDFVDNGFDLDIVPYDSFDTSDKTAREVCETPNFDKTVSAFTSNTVISTQNNILCKDNMDANGRSQIDNAQEHNLHSTESKLETSCGNINPFNQENIEEEREENVDGLNKAMIRQMSSGFVLKSPPCLGDSEQLKVPALSFSSHDSTGNKEPQNSQKKSSEWTNKFVPESVEGKIDHCSKKTTKNSFKEEITKHQASVLEKDCGGKLFHQDSFGFKPTSDEFENYGDISNVQNTTVPVTDIHNNECDNSINIVSTVKATEMPLDTVKEKEIKSENAVFKEKYLSFIESRRSSQDSIESVDKEISDSHHKSHSLHNKDIHNSFVCDISEIELDPAKTTLDSQNNAKDKRKSKILNRKSEKFDNRIEIRTVNSSPVNFSDSKKTLRQLVLHGLETKAVPSSTVISPEISGHTKQHKNRPKSQTSLHSESPVSPLLPSPFDFSMPLLLSPLPPSPTRMRESVSPLPGSPWVDDVVSGLNFQHNSPINIGKEFPRKRTKSRPCSFSSDVPSHAIHVKPISACNTSLANNKSVEKITKAVPAERDPLGRKQRVSRVPKQVTAQKRKSLEPVSSETKEKKKCPDEKSSVSIQDKVTVKQEPGYWKDVDIYLQQYISIYDMTSEDVCVKLLTDKDVAAVFPAVILWTTQYLRGSEAEMVNKIYDLCKEEKDAKSGPFLTVQESRLVEFFIHIIQKKLWDEFKTRLLDSLWNSIMLKDVVPILGRTGLCRVFTAVCQKEGDLEYVRVLYYHIVTSGYQKFITLGMSIASIWPQVLYKSDTEASSLMTTFEFCIMKILLTDRAKYEKLIVIFSTLCNWSKPPKMDTVVVLKKILQDLQTVTRQDESASVVSDRQFDLYKSLELLLLTEDNVFFKRTFTMTCLNQMFQKIKTINNMMNGGLPVSYIGCIINVSATVLARKIDRKYATKTISKFMFGLLTLVTVTTEVQEVVASAMIDIAFISPMSVFSHLTQWYMREQKNISPQLKQRLENARKMLMPHEGKLTSFSFH